MAEAEKTESVQPGGLSALNQAKRVVVKVGTQVVMNDEGQFAVARLAALVEDCAQLMKAGREVLLVSSGAVGLGRQLLGLGKPLSLNEKQACAAVGQNLLMDAYRDLFKWHGLNTAQILLTAWDFSDRTRYLNLRKTLDTLLSLGVVPIINENDTVSTSELEENMVTRCFGDNDKLSALVSAKLEADLLVILTNVDGIFTDNPILNPEARLIPRITRFEELSNIELNGQSDHGRGGMASKLEAARIASISGVHTVIASGYRSHIVKELFSKEEVPCTQIPPQATISGRKRWIGLASGSAGVVVVNEGAKNALLERHASLLPIGVVDVQGEFKPRQVVSIQDEQGVELGRGLINFSAEDTRRILGRPSQEIVALLGEGATHDVVIQRDNLVIFQEYET